MPNPQLGQMEQRMENDPDRFRKPAPVIDLTPEVLAELQRLVDEVQKVASVTGLPWRSEPSGGKPLLCANKATKGCCIAYGTIGSWKEIDLAVAAVNALPAMLQTIRPTPDGEIGELVGRLRDNASLMEAATPFFSCVERMRQAATALESQAADIARLRELLLQARHHVVFTMDVDPNAADLANAIDAALATRTNVR